MTPAALQSIYAKLTSGFQSADATCPDVIAHLLEGARIHMCSPFGDLTGGEDYYAQVYQPLRAAIPDLERRDMIVIAGTTPQGGDWVGVMGNFMGTFTAPFLEIPPTGHLVHMRYHEFFQVQAGRISQVQAIWDIPELMMQAHAWPLAPQLGAFLCTPAPMTSDGLAASGQGHTALALVQAMITDLCRYPHEDSNPKSMRLEHYWHPQLNWYGPAGIGTARGVSGFRHWHQIPFLHAMPDRRVDAQAELGSHWFAQGDYVAETGWPNMRVTHRGGGWMGLVPTGKEVLLRSLDFWRVEQDKIRENWVLVDLLDLYAQLGFDVFARLRDFNKARHLGRIALGSAYCA